MARAGASDGDVKPGDDQFTSEEPLAEWERDLLGGTGTTAVTTEEEATSPDVISESGAVAEQVAEAAAIAVDETPADEPVIGGTAHVHTPETGEDA
jgi:hypothetical protein